MKIDSLDRQEKTCSKCNESKLRENFPKEAKRKDGLYPWCKDCLSAHRKERYIKRDKKYILEYKQCSKCKKDKKRTEFRLYENNNLHYRCIQCEDIEEENKKQGLLECSSCKILKPVEDFYESKIKKTMCKKCHAESLSSDKNKNRDRYLRRVFGITLEQYNELLEKQNYRCAICDRHENQFKKRLAVDHAHRGPKAGLIRALLCDNCNRNIIGRHVDPQVFRKAAEYLENADTGWYVPDEYLKGVKKKRKRKKK